MFTSQNTFDVNDCFSDIDSRRNLHTDFAEVVSSGDPLLCR